MVLIKRTKILIMLWWIILSNKKQMDVHLIYLDDKSKLAKSR